MEHRQIIDWAIEATQELLQKQGNIQETDIRDRIIEKFNSKRQRDYTSDKEHENRSDLIVYHKGKPYLIYEFKKYFKPIRKSDIAEIQKDFGKLHKAHQTHSSCKTYFVLVSTCLLYTSIPLRIWLKLLRICILAIENVCYYIEVKTNGILIKTNNIHFTRQYFGGLMKIQIYNRMNIRNDTRNWRRRKVC